MNFQKIIQKTVRSALPYLGAGIMMFLGGASMQSCSPYKTISGTAEIIMVKYNQEEIEKIDLVSIKMNNDKNEIYHIKFNEPKPSDSVFNTYHLKKIKLQSRNTKKELRKMKKENKKYEFSSYEAIKLSN